MIWQSPGLPRWRKVNLITVTRRPLHPSIAAGFYCLTTSPGFLPTLCEKWSGFFYVHRVWLSYTRDRRLKVSSERLGNEDKAPCPRALLPGRGSNRGPPVWKSEVLTARPRQLLNRYDRYDWSVSSFVYNYTQVIFWVTEYERSKVNKQKYSTETAHRKPELEIMDAIIIHMIRIDLQWRIQAGGQHPHPPSPHPQI